MVVEPVVVVSVEPPVVITSVNGRVVMADVKPPTTPVAPLELAPEPVPVAVPVAVPPTVAEYDERAPGEV